MGVGVGVRVRVRVRVEAARRVLHLIPHKSVTIRRHRVARGHRLPHIGRKFPGPGRIRLLLDL